jgi:hypothetical protein
MSGVSSYRKPLSTVTSAHAICRCRHCSRAHLPLYTPIHPFYLCTHILTRTRSHCTPSPSLRYVPLTAAGAPGTLFWGPRDDVRQVERAECSVALLDISDMYLGRQNQAYSTPEVCVSVLYVPVDA